MDLNDFNDLAFGGDRIEARLATRGFAVAVDGAWSLGGSRYTTQLLEFTTSEGAEGYVFGQTSAFTSGSDWGNSFPMPGLVSARGFVQRKPSASGVTETVLVYADGPIAIIMFVDSHGKPDRLAEIAAMQRQVDALIK